MKQSNVCGAKELAIMRMDEKETTAVPRDGAWLSTKLASITRIAEENRRCKFTSLAYMLNEDFLKECFRELKRDKSPGIDGISVAEYEKDLEINIKDLVERLKGNRYRPQPVKRVYIPKADGKKRPLGIPTVEDKVVQMGIKKILEAIYEVDFIDVSFGFRPNKSCHKALDRVNRVIFTKPVRYVVDADIEKFFDTVDHEWLKECLKQRIADPRLMNLINRFLSVGIMEEGKYIEGDKGTPQGGVLSPMLANIYLHYILDLWFEKKVKRESKGYLELIRYADDFVICLEEKETAGKIKGMLSERMRKFGLKLSESKMRIIEFGRDVWKRAKITGEKIEQFDFLGITHYCTTGRKGKFKLGRKTARKKYIQKLKTVNLWLKGIRNKVKLKVWWKTFQSKVSGHYRYYGIGGNSQGITNFHYKVRRLAFEWINRRSQRKSYSWKQFDKFLEYNPLPKLKIYHPYPVF